MNKYFRLENGMKVCLINNNTETVFVGIMIKVGANNELID